MQWEKHHKHTTCKLSDLEKNTNCIELVYFDIVEPFIETAEKLAKDRED